MDDFKSEKLSHEATEYDFKTIAEIVYDFAVVRGDLVEQYARDQLVRIIERRISQTLLGAADEIASWNTPSGWIEQARVEIYLRDRAGASDA